MIKIKRMIALILVIIIAASGAVIYINIPLRSKIGNYINKLEGKTLSREFKYRIKSGNLSTDYNIETVMEDIDKFKLNTINLPVAVKVDSLKSSDMNLDEESIKKAKQLLKKLRFKRINIILEPYPWIENGVKYETDWNPEDKAAFFENWRVKVMDRLIREIAVPFHVDAVIVASNLVHLEGYEREWENIIDYVRQYYMGLVTYKTSWWYTAKWDKKSIESYEKKLNNPIFSKVDYISIAAYFELSEKPINNIEEIEKTLFKTSVFNREQNVYEEIRAFNLKWNKPIFFGELGFPRRNGAAIQPWNPIPSDIENGLEQANCFEAYKRTFKDKWFLGFSIFAVGERGLDKNYYPSRESSRVFENWFVQKEVIQ